MADKMKTRISFGPNGQITVTNMKVGDPSDSCHGDLAKLHDLLGQEAEVLAEVPLGNCSSSNATSGISASAPKSLTKAQQAAVTAAQNQQLQVKGE